MQDASPEMLSIFAGAIERPSAGERAAFLDAACRADGNLRRRIEALLRAHEEAGGFLQGQSESSDPAATVDRWGGEGPSDVIGPYKLLEQLGEGGFGVVFLAEQSHPVRRKVALKILKPGMDTRQVVARFEAERQALAIMDHPNIARVFDGGATAAGRPFFVMELVKGIPITEYCDRNQLPLRERLQLFADVCRAIQHAHQKGIIHRDIKPSNVLISRHDTTPLVKVIDFGVAKALGQELTDKTLHTGVAQMIGTPLYMSPEQAGMSDLDVDTRSDIYSLGVLLYELLTGTTPFEKERFKTAGYDEIRRIIREEEPPKPSTRVSTRARVGSTVTGAKGTDPRRMSKVFRGELDWVVMKALEKDRSRRYETASGFAADVRRYLADEPVLACPPSVGYRLRKFVRRNRPVVVTVTVVAAALLAGTAVAIWQAIVATGAKQDALLAVEAEVQAKKRAESNLAVANQSIEIYLGTVTNDPDLRGSDFQLLRKKLLESALPFLQRLSEENGHDPEGEARRGRAYLRLALVYAALGEFDKAIQNFEAMEVVFSRLTAERPSVAQYHQQLAWSYHNLGNKLRDLGKRPEAEAAYRRALEVKEKLVAEFPYERQYRLELARSHNSLGILLKDWGNVREATESYRRAFKIREQLVADFPNEPLYMAALADSHTSLGLLSADLRKWPEAIAAHQNALAIQEKLVASSHAKPEHRRNLATTLNNLAIALENRGPNPEATAAYQRALVIRERLVADFPSAPAYAVELAGSYCNHGHQARGRGELNDALGWFDKAIARLEPIVAKEPRLVLARTFLRNSYVGRALTLYQLQRYPESIKSYDRALGFDDGNGGRTIRSKRAGSLLRISQVSKDAAGCLSAAAEIESLRDAQPLNLACVRAICAAVILQDPKTPVADAGRLASEQADLAMAWLRKAVAQGANDVEKTLQHTDFDALRERDDFKRLLSELRATKKR